MQLSVNHVSFTAVKAGSARDMAVQLKFRK